MTERGIGDNISTDPIFVEIRPPHTPTLPKLVEVYVAQVEPTSCRSLLKALARDFPLKASTATESEPPLVDLSHLKRVKRSAQTTTPGEATDGSPCQKKQKHDSEPNHEQQSCPPLLEIILRDVASLEGEFGTKMRKQSNGSLSIADFFKSKYNVDSIAKRMVPGRPPESSQEWRDFQKEFWPTLFFPQRSKEHQDQQLQLTPEEIRQMERGMELAIRDMRQSAMAGAVIVDPATGKLVASAGEERRRQLEATEDTPTPTPSILCNPLATSILLAIQGVSRLEREKAMAAGMGSSEFQKGQYLCNNLVLYTTLEPTVLEAMSLVHSRIHRLVFGRSHSAGGIHLLYVHALPSTNHHYRAFQCTPGSDLWNQCQP